MAYTYNSIEWYFDYDPIDDLRDLEVFIRKYGVVNIGGDRWAVVEDDHSTPHLAVKKLTTVSGRDTALGFIKLLTEK